MSKELNGNRDEVVKKEGSKYEELQLSDDVIVEKAMEELKKGSTYEDVQKKYNLSDDDMDALEIASEILGFYINHKKI